MSTPATHSHHLVKVYLAVFGALAVLTALTVGVAYMHLARPLAIGIAALIAAIKVSLIALFFMHLKFERGLIYAIVFTALVLVGILALALMPDIAHACAMCFGSESGASNLARGFYWGAWLLLALPFFLVTTITLAIVRSARKKRTVA